MAPGRGSGPDDFDEWVRPHLSAMHRYAARRVGVAQADDVVQEALVRAWRRRSTYDVSRGEPLAWLLGIVRDRAARQRRPRGVSLDRDHEVHQSPADLDLERALARLTRRQRDVIDLYYFVDLDVANVAGALGVAPGTVRATLHQARGALRALLAEEGASND